MSIVIFVPDNYYNNSSATIHGVMIIIIIVKHLLRLDPQIIFKLRDATTKNAEIQWWKCKYVFNFLRMVSIVSEDLITIGS